MCMCTRESSAMFEDSTLQINFERLPSIIFWCSTKNINNYLKSMIFLPFKSNCLVFVPSRCSKYFGVWHIYCITLLEMSLNTAFVRTCFSVLNPEFGVGAGDGFVMTQSRAPVSLVSCYEPCDFCVGTAVPSISPQVHFLIWLPEDSLSSQFKMQGSQKRGFWSLFP